MFIHDRGHLVYNSLYNFGSVQIYSLMEFGDYTSTVIHELHRKEVSYLKDDPRTPCNATTPREEEMNTCIQHFLENKVGCQLPWHNDASNLSKCTVPDQLKKFVKAYDDIVSLSGFSIAKETGCLPSCTINEYTVNVIKRFSYQDDKPRFSAYFFYPGARYTEKVYFYTYDFTSYIADAGGLVGLFLGYSILSVYDGLKYVWKNK